MTQDIPKIDIDCTFYYLAKFDGDQPEKPAVSDHESLCMDLLNPQCVELVVGGKDRPTQIWRK